MDDSPMLWEWTVPPGPLNARVEVLGHHVQELALLGQTGEHRAHVPNGHVADARGDRGQSQGAPWGGEAGGALGEAVQKAWAQRAREQA